jgi:mannose-6-phosphate isomerase-like protein (cupin superfamily)/uncharacterized protein YndB with AHSA1/START domain
VVGPLTQSGAVGRFGQGAIIAQSVPAAERSPLGSPRDGMGGGEIQEPNDATDGAPRRSDEPLGHPHGTGHAPVGEQLDVQALGVTFRLRPAGTTSDEQALTFDVLGRPQGFIADPRLGRHVHPTQTEHLEVLSGELQVELDADRHRLHPGESIEIPRGMPHLQLGAGGEPGHVRIRVTPAGRTEAYLRRLAQLSDEGGFDREGRPRPLAGARMLLDFSDVGYATIAPLWVQRAAATALLVGARHVAAARHWSMARRAHLWRAYEFVDEWEVAASPQAVYDVLIEGRTYPEWWRPVYIDVQSDGSHSVGSISRQHFKGRLPYHLHTTSTITRLEPGRLIEAEVDGDLRGTGIWTLAPTPRGCSVRFDWTVHADRPLLRVLTPFLRPALRSNHSWAIARAMEGLEPHVAARGARRPAGGPPTDPA